MSTNDRLNFSRNSLRRTSDNTLRPQLEEIAFRALDGNRGRGWAREIGPIEDRYISQEKGYVFSSWIRFYRTHPIDPEREESQRKIIYEFALAAGHHSRYGSNPWIGEIPKEPSVKTELFDPGLGIPGQAEESLNVPSDDLDDQYDYTPLASIKHPIKPGEWYSHLFDLDAQIKVLLSSIQAAIDSKMENRFHSLLWGSPGGGKTDILLSTGRLLRHLGVNFASFDAASMTEAGVRKILLDEDELVPDVILLEEIDKVISENSLRWLLGVMDYRGVLSQTNYRKTATREVKALVLATANDYNALGKMMGGALLSRFGSEIFCPQSSRETLAKILERDLKKLLHYDLAWIEPTLQFCVDEQGITDPRKLQRVCLCGKESLLDGSYQESLRRTTKGSGHAMISPGTVNLALY